MAIPRNLYRHLECLGIKVHDWTLQRWALLGTANILRKVLSVWGHWLDRKDNLRQELQYQRLLWEINDHNNNNNLCTRCSDWYSVTIRPWDLFSRALVDMEKITRGIIGLFPKRWTVRTKCFRRILENYAVLMEEWDVFLSERLQPDVRVRIIGCKT